MMASTDYFAIQRRQSHDRVSHVQFYIYCCTRIGVCEMTDQEREFGVTVKKLRLDSTNDKTIDQLDLSSL